MLPAGAPSSGISTGRAVDRLINFSDAVVAVAITLMALPLIDIEMPSTGGSAWGLLRDHEPQISTFLFTFYLVSIMWLAHNRILNVIVGYDAAVFWLNTTWLVAIVLLPWVSALSGEASRTEGGVGVLYWFLLAFISILGSAIAHHIRRHPHLLAPEAQRALETQPGIGLRGPLFAGYFAFIGVMSVVVPTLSYWLPLGIIPLSIWLRPAREDLAKQNPDPAEEAATKET